MPDAAPPAAPSPLPWNRRLAEIALLVAVFALCGAWPVPEVNEPHYLGKVKHYWDPSFAPGDFFFESPDAHLAFTVLFGWPTKFLALPVYAWLGRLGVWLALAIAWQRLSWQLLPRPWWAVFAGGLFIVFQEKGQMAGEWIVGGFEAKGPAYALAFFALGDVAQRRWNRAFTLLGLSAAVHVLVGGWMAGLALSAWWLTDRKQTPFRALAPGLAAGGALGLVGLVPALQLSWSATAAEAAEAQRLYVFDRLAHHLDLRAFRWEFVEAHLLLVSLWAALLWLAPPRGGARRVQAVVGMAVAAAAVGAGLNFALAAWPDLAAGALRFYWYRLTDILAPVGAALALAGYLAELQSARPRSGLAWGGLGLVLCGLHLAHHAWETPLGTRPRADKPGKVSDYAGWRAVCDWVAAETPPDARFLTPYAAQTFKWYTGRSEVVTWKDMPQDPTGILAWQMRMEEVFGTGRGPADRWFSTLAERDPQTLRRLGAKHQAEYLLTTQEPPLDLPRVYPRNATENATYAVYRLTPAGP